MCVCGGWEGGGAGRITKKLAQNVVNNNNTVTMTMKQKEPSSTLTVKASR